MRGRVVNRVKEFRTRAGISQEALARAVGVSRQSIISIELERYIPSLPLALRIAGFFRRPTDDLFQWREAGKDG